MSADTQPQETDNDQTSVFLQREPDASGEYLVILCGETGPEEQPGWYFMVGDEPYGPWSTESDAQAEAAGIN